MREWLKEIRQAKKLTQKEVASACGIAMSYYGLIETGIRGKPLNVNIAKAIGHVLDFDWRRFYDDDSTYFS